MGSVTSKSAGACRDTGSDESLDPFSSVIPAAIKRFAYRRFPRQVKFLQARLARQGLFGLYLTVGAALLAGVLWLFGGIAEDLITGDPLILIDARLSEWFRTLATPRFTGAMQVVSAMASTPTVVILSTMMIVFLAVQQLWHRLLALVLAVAGGIVLSMALKVLFGRERPSWADAALTDAGFPSGHTMMATILYGFVAVYFIVPVQSWSARFFIALGTMTLIVLVALSRLYLGAHYLSDVLAAMAAGTAWLVLCLTAAEMLRRYRSAPYQRRPTGKSPHAF
jgi:undecaprenyl-diphosphatase